MGQTVKVVLVVVLYDESSNRAAVSSERRNISAIIRVTDSEEARCSVDEQTMAGD